MRTLIHKIRNKPEAHRKRVALAFSGGVTLLLFGIWMATLPARFAQFGPKDVAAVSASSPVGTLKQNFSESYQTLKNNITGATTTSSYEAGLPSAPENTTYVSNGVIISDPN